MIVSIHQPSYLPWLGYFHRIGLSDLHIILDTVQFTRGKDSFINRNKIRTPQGWMWLTVPVCSPQVPPPLAHPPLAPPTEGRVNQGFDLHATRGGESELRGEPPHLTLPPLRGEAPHLTLPPLSGEAPHLTLPPLRGEAGGGGNPPINETRINNSTPWAKKHRNALETSYRSAPFWKQYGPPLLSLFDTHWDLLCPLNLAFTRWCLDQLGIKTRIRLASELGSHKQKSDLVLDLCRKVAATTYVSGTLGRHYLDERSFEEAGIRLIYQDYRHPVYPQRFEPFVPYMSIVDLLMNCGPESLAILMGGQGREELGPC